MVFEAVKKLIVERTDKNPDEITRETRFEELGIDSLDTVEMLMDLAEEIGKDVELKEKVDTVGELVDIIEADLNA